MKRKLLLTIMILVIGIAIGNAEAKTQVKFEGQSLELNQRVKAECFHNLIPGENNLNVPKKIESTTMLPLTINTEIDNEEWSTNYIFSNYIVIYNSENYYTTLLTYNAFTGKWNTEYNLEVKPGTYDIMLWMSRFSEKYYLEKQVYVVHENVVIEEENQIITISPAEATECVHFTSTLPTGNKVKLPTWAWNEEKGYWDFEEIEPGNTSNISIMSLFTDTKYHITSYMGSTAFYID